MRLSTVRQPEAHTQLKQARSTICEDPHLAFELFKRDHHLIFSSINCSLAPLGL